MKTDPPTATPTAIGTAELVGLSELGSGWVEGDGEGVVEGSGVGGRSVPTEFGSGVVDVEVVVVDGAEGDGEGTGDGWDAVDSVFGDPNDGWTELGLVEVGTGWPSEGWTEFGLVVELAGDSGGGRVSLGLAVEEAGGSGAG